MLPMPLYLPHGKQYLLSTDITRSLFSMYLYRVLICNQPGPTLYMYNYLIKEYNRQTIILVLNLYRHIHLHCGLFLSKQNHSFNCNLFE